MKYDEHGNLVEIVNGVRVVHTPEGLVVGEGIERVLIRGVGLKISDASNFIQGHYPDTYPFSAPHRHPEEDIYINFSLDPDFPPDGIPLDRLPKVIRELKKLVAGTTAVKTTFPSSVKDGMLVVWNEQKKQYVPATCPAARADIAAGLFFNGIADLATNSVITSSTVTNNSWNLVEGKKYFLDCSRPGYMTDKDTGYFVGIAQGPHTIYLAPLADSAESLITALEVGLKAEEEARKAADAAEASARQQAVTNEASARQNADNAIIARLDRNDTYFCTNVKDCILGTNSGAGSGVTPPSGGLVDEIFLSGGGLKKDPSSGKLILDCNAVSNCIAGTSFIGNLVSPGGGITQDATTGKLKIECAGLSSCISQNVANMITASSGLTFSDGKLYVDFSQLPADRLKAIVSSMIKTGGGLSVDPTTGKYYFDPNAMDTSVFLELLKKLNLPQLVTSNLTFYVDKNHANAADTIVDGRGLTPSLPFATIQGCIKYVCENLNFASYTVTIKIADGTYEECLTLMEYARTTGQLTIQPVNASDGSNRKVIIKNPANKTDAVLKSVGTGTYNIRELGLYYYIRPSLITSNIYAGAAMFESACQALLFGVHCEIKDEDSGNYGSAGKANLFLVESSSGCNLQLRESTNLAINLLAPATQREDTTTYALAANSSGTLLLRNGSALAKAYCGGAFSTFARAYMKGLMSLTGSGVTFAFANASGRTVTGQKYKCEVGGGMSFNQGPDYLPGSSAGSADASSYSYYE